MILPKIVRHGRATLSLFSLISVLFLLGCQPIQPETPTPDATVTPSEEATPVAETPALPPVTLLIPDLALELPITEMGWTITEANGQRTTEWIVPTETVGWHVNSAGAGGNGNTILSGHQITGAAVFAPLALGDIVVGQELQLVDEAGNVFVYEVSEISEPVAIVGATEEDNALAATYVAPTEQAQLTLVTGWPDFTTTHRIFAVADYVGPEE